MGAMQACFLPAVVSFVLLQKGENVNCFSVFILQLNKARPTQHTPPIQPSQLLIKKKADYGNVLLSLDMQNVAYVI